MKTRIAIAVAGALGMAIILKTSAYYASMDGLAFALTLTMGAALAAGLWELWTLAGKTEQLRAELAALPSDVDNSHLDRVSPMLRALLRARLDRTALPVPGPVFAPYIIGLLVMLGLLGTFMGLFETLRGASTALTTSADVEALRSGLKQPMQGLMRSFGTSATGVAASAMLGLASVFVRRAGGRLGVLLHEVASGPLARFSPAHRQLMALEALSAQGEALPQAAEALREASQRLDALRDHFRDTLAEGDKRRAEQQDKATTRVMAEVERARKELEALAGRNEKAIAGLGASWEKGHKVVEKALGAVGDRNEKAITDLGAKWDSGHKVVEKALGAVGDRNAKAIADLGAKWDSGHKVVEKALGAVGDRNEKAIAELTTHWETAHARVAQETSATLKDTLDQVSASIDRGVIQAAERASETLSPLLSQAVEKTVEAATSHLDAVLNAVQEDANARREAQAAATDALEQRVTSLLSALGTLEAERRAADQDQLSRFEEKTGALLAERSAADEALLKRLSDHLATYQSSRADADAAALERLDAHAGTIVQALEGHRESQAEQLTAQERALLDHQQAALASLDAQRAATREEHASLLQQLDAQAKAAREADEARSRELFTAVDGTLSHLQTFARETTEREQLRAEEAKAMSERVTRDLADAAQLVRDRLSRSEETEQAQQARSERLFETLSSAADTIGKAAQSQVGALAEFVQTTEARMREAEQSAQARMQEFLQGIQDRAEAQQERLLTLERSLSEARTQSEAAAEARAEKTLERIAAFGSQLEEQGTRSATTLTEQVAALGAGLLTTEERLLDKHKTLSEQLQHQADEQAARFAQVQDTLLSQQAKRSEELSELFASQLQTLESKVAESTGLINEAAQLVKGGGAELVTVAETFSAAVEQQRQATQQWLDSLGDIERTVTDAGEAAAADVLGQHLARTHEVFDRQLRFQQELIEQLRTTPRRETVQEAVSDATA